MNDIANKTQAAFDDAFQKAGGGAKELDPREVELEQLRAKRAELQAKREQREEQNALGEALELERRKLREEEALDEAVQQYGPVDRALAIVETDAGIVILRRATTMKFQRFMDQEKYTSDAVTSFVRPCVVYPPAGEFDDLIKEQPVVAFRCGTALTRLAGARIEELGKK